jgi:hypothetical protein
MKINTTEIHITILDDKAEVKNRIITQRLFVKNRIITQRHFILSHGRRNELGYLDSLNDCILNTRDLIYLE